MKLFHRYKLAKTSIIVFSILYIFLACTEKSPLSSLSLEKPQASVQILESKTPKHLAKLFGQKAMIDNDGGTIVVGDAENGYSYLQFPEDAIDEDDYPNGVAIVLYWQTDGLFQIDCYPEGIQFERPVTMSLSYKNAKLISVNEYNLDLYYFNPQNNQYESIGGIVNSAQQKVTGTINHFSRYAIGYE